MYLGPDQSDEEYDDGHQKDNEDRHMIGVVKVSKDKLEVDGILGLEEAGAIAGEMVGLALGPDPHVVLEENLDRLIVERETERQRERGNRKIFRISPRPRDRPTPQRRS